MLQASRRSRTLDEIEEIVERTAGVSPSKMKKMTC